ncbi:MAG: hypothetical protein LBL55_06370, partial [Propionibacteriaceae bacterium]|nr:hypothetical protein [Propionibacteriaceae bacterium]
MTPEHQRRLVRPLRLIAGVGLVLALAGCAVTDQTDRSGPTGGEASLVLPDLGQVKVLGFDARWCLALGLVVCLAGLCFGAISYSRLKRLPVHQSMREVSELIYSTCKAY